VNRVYISGLSSVKRTTNPFLFRFGLTDLPLVPLAFPNSAAVGHLLALFVSIFVNRGRGGDAGVGAGAGKFSWSDGP